MEEDEETRAYRQQIEKQKAEREKLLREKEMRRKRAAGEKTETGVVQVSFFLLFFLFFFLLDLKVQIDWRFEFYLFCNFGLQKIFK